jgi:hypothetical protein
MLGAFLPPFVGWIIITLAVIAEKISEIISNPLSLLFVFMGSLFLFIGAFLFLIIPSIIYSFIMEFLIIPHIKSKIIVVILSSSMGFVSGLLVYLAMSEFKFLMPLGFVVGIIVGWILVTDSASLNSLRSLKRS